MAKQIEGVYERVLECAKEEFLKKGFSEASLREIAAAADTSTGSIYTRFTDKAGLFRTLVEPAAEEFKDLARASFHQTGSGTADGLRAYGFCTQLRIIDYIYDHFDAFCLLLTASHGTEYAYYIDELVDVEVQCTNEYLGTIQPENKLSDDITEGVVHVLTTAYFNALFEVVRHKMSKDTAVGYAKAISRYHTAGFREIFGKAED